MIDEFGKNLEAAGEGSVPSEADPYLLQQIAESAGGRGLPIFVVTLQHQSFDDYLTAASSVERREWAKVRGRFEEIAYVESPAQTRALIGSVFEVSDKALSRRIRSWAHPQALAMQTLGIKDLSAQGAVASCWPLRPITAVVLSELCRRYGQHERTLFSFLTAREVTGRFLGSKSPSTNGTIPALGLDAVYDYFVDSGNLVPETSASSRRWTEISTRIRDTHGLSDEQLRVAKAVAMLNLISASGTIRASTEVVELAEPDSAPVLKELETLGLVTFRSFADEYRIWQGTDVDLEFLLEQARQQVAALGLSEIVASMPKPAPAVAARHSAQHHCLRVFDRRFVSGQEQIEPLDVSSPYDGQVLHVIDAVSPPPIAELVDGVAKPTIAVIPDRGDLEELTATAQEVLSLQRVLANEEVRSDWVARHELSERCAIAQSAFDSAVFSAFSDGSCRWFLLDGDQPTELRPGRGSSVLSDAADRSFCDTPVVANEMINRARLTTQGAKARRMLIEAMIEHSSEPQLGLVGNGPEVAMYTAVLSQPGLHVTDQATGEARFTVPGDADAYGADAYGADAEASLGPVRLALEAEFKRAKAKRVNLGDVDALLRSPPFGMKAGVVPVIVVAGLLARKDLIAVYEHGTFKPRLTVDLAERMVKNPGFFEIKHFANSQGARLSVVAALNARLGVRRDSESTQAHSDLRVSNVLVLVSDLVARVRRLDNYTKRTSGLPADALAVRDTTLSAVEPDELLFRSLPAALGMPEVPVDDSAYPEAEAFAAQLVCALEMLEGAHDRLLADALQLLVSVSGGSTWREVVARVGAIDAEALDPAIRPFVLTLANTGTDDELAWIAMIATVVVNKSPAEWTDDDVSRFWRVLPEQMAAVERLLALHGDVGDLEQSLGVTTTNGVRAASDTSDGTPRALRVSVTAPDGREHARLVTVAKERFDCATGVLEEAVAKVENELGSRQQAENLLLALLGRRMLESQR